MSNLTYISPFFIVEHLRQSVAFYVDKLGFEVRFTGPAEDPYWTIVGRGKISIMLKAITPDIKPVPNHTRHEWARWDAYISVEDPDSLFEEYRAGGVNFHQPLKNDGDGLRGFEVADADGYVLFFGRPVPQESPMPSTVPDVSAVPSAPSVPAFKKMSPQLLVTHIEHSIEFYTNELGFSLDFRYEDFYAGIVKDGHSIHLKCGAPPESGPPPESGAPTSNPGKNKDDLEMMFSVDNIDRLYAEFLGKSIDIVQPLRDMPYGREFYIADPDGNRIAFIE